MEVSEMDSADHTEGQVTGKLDALKGARPVWRGEVRKVPYGNSLAPYPVRIEHEATIGDPR